MMWPFTEKAKAPTVEYQKIFISKEHQRLVAELADADCAARKKRNGNATTHLNLWRFIDDNYPKPPGRWTLVVDAYPMYVTNDPRYAE